jgi:hypothetical protein
MLNVAVPEPCLQRPGIVPLVGKLITATVAQHVRMDREGHSSSLAEALDQGMEALRRHGRTTLRDEHVRARRLFALQPTQRPQLIALQWMDRGRARLERRTWSRPAAVRHRG